MAIFWIFEKYAFLTVLQPKPDRGKNGQNPDWIFNFDVESWLFRDQVGKNSLIMAIFWIFEKYAFSTVLRPTLVTLTLTLTLT